MIGTSMRRFEPITTAPCQRVELRDTAAERRRRRIRGLVAEVALPQAVIDVVAAEVARDAVQQVQLLESWQLGDASTPIESPPACAASVRQLGRASSASGQERV